jgi:hypothetical protein
VADDWHLFDSETGYEVRQLGDGSYEARPVDAPDEVTRLSTEEFEEWRAEGPNPRGLP